VCVCVCLWPREAHLEFKTVNENHLCVMRWVRRGDLKYWQPCFDVTGVFTLAGPVSSSFGGVYLSVKQTPFVLVGGKFSSTKG